MRLKKVGVLVFGVALSVLILKSMPTHAQTKSSAFSITTSPTSINISGVPGETITAEIRVKNDSTVKNRLKVTLMKFAAGGEDGKASLLDRGANDDYFDWVTFSPSVFDAAPNEWETIKMIIAMPKSAAFGYYFAPTFSLESAPKVTSKSNSLLGSVAVLVLVEAKVPGAQRTASLASFTTSRKSYEFLPATFSIKVKNSGNVHLIPNGDVVIKRGNKEIGRIPVNSAHGNVLPNSSRTFTTSWNDGYPFYTEKTVNGVAVHDKKGDVVKALSWNTDKISHLRIGKYTAQLIMVYDDGSRDVPLQATVTFWVIPWRLIGIAVLVLVIPASGVYLVMRRRLNKIRKVTKRI